MCSIRKNTRGTLEVIREGAPDYTDYADDGDYDGDVDRTDHADSDKNR
jgi:hypothetical protein